MPANYRILGVVASLVVLLATNAGAYLPGTMTRAIQSANGEYLLVLLDPDRSERREYDPAIDGQMAEDWIRANHDSILNQQRIEGLYSQSGLYRNNGSATLLWPIKYLSVSKEIYVANDGIHVVVAFLNWDADNVSDRGDALEFYANGQQLAAYHEEQLINGYLARAILSNFAGAAWVTCESASLNNDTATFEIITNHGDAFGFDITTAKLVYSRLPWTLMAISILVTFAIAAWWLWWRIARARHSTASAPP